MSGIWDMSQAAKIATGLMLALLLTSCAARPWASKPLRRFDVRSTGAAGDARMKDTPAFQRALDECAAGGGGEVVVPPGQYLIGSIELGSNTTLRLESGAVLIASPDAADYPLMTVRWEGVWREGHRALIYAAHCSHIAVVGGGSMIG